MKIAAIDIGSNAIRVTIALKPEKNFHHPSELILKERYFCRTGQEVFQTGCISNPTFLELQSIFKNIHKLFKKHHVQQVQGVATSSFREASNGSIVLSALNSILGFECRIIDGSLEAKLMSEGLERRGYFNHPGHHLHIDLGGGSLELALHNGSHFVWQKSLNIGALKLSLAPKSNRTSLLQKEFNLHFSDAELAQLKQVSGLFYGTGGNFKRILKITKTDKITLNQLQRIELCSASELEAKHNIKPENFSLLEPSIEVLLFLNPLLQANQLLVPDISLSSVLLDFI